MLPGRHSQGTPAVKYRGFFINDENPALGTWAPNFFGPGLAPATRAASTGTSTPRSSRRCSG
ncbi:glycosyl hydrolase 115 family protein [Plantactinospora veratri]